MVRIRCEVGEITLVDEPAYDFGSADNARAYPVECQLGSGTRATSSHGVLVDGVPFAVVGADGGATGVHVLSALVLDGQLYLAVGDSVACLQLRPCRLLWTTQMAPFTCFGLHHHAASGALISHGELEMRRFTAQGDVLWEAGGADIFTGACRLEANGVVVEDFHGDVYRFRYDTGAHVC